MARILIVEDEMAIADLIRLNLQLAGHESIHVDHGTGVMPCVQQQKPDLILLDVMLPGMDGFTLMEQIAPLNIPVIFLTARDQLADKVHGFRLGADDYVVKPFEAMELLARIEAVLKRTAQDTGPVVTLGDVEVRLPEHTAIRQGEAVELTAKEFALLEALLANKNIVLSRERLLEIVWGYDYLGETRTVDVHIQRLRKKLGFEDRIKTVHRVGYRLEVEA